MAGLVAAGDRDGRRRVEPPVVEPVREHQQVAGEPVATDVRDLPRVLGMGGRQGRGHRPAALGAAGVVPAVRADAVDVAGVALQPGRPAGAQSPPRSRSRMSSLVVQVAALQPGPVRIGVRREHRRVVPRCGAGRAGVPAAPARLPRRPCSPQPRRRGRRAAGRRAARRRPTSRRARAARTRAPSRRCRPAARRAGRWRRAQRKPGSGRIIRRPRAAPRGPGAGRAPGGSAGRAGRRGRRAAARAARGSPPAPGRSQPGTSIARSPSRTSSRSPRSSSTHGCPGRRRSRVSSARSRTARTSLSPPGTRGLRVVRNRRTSACDRGRRVDPAYVVGEGLQPVGELVGERRRASSR